LDGYERARAHIDAALAWAIEKADMQPVEDARPRFALQVPPDLMPLDPAEPFDERSAAWRTVDAGTVVLDVPPGVVGRGLGGDAPAPPGLRPSTVAWFRGSFVDREGTAVTVGDVDRAGYVDLWTSKDGEGEVGRWVGEGEGLAPADRLRGDPEAVRVRGIDYLDAVGPPTGAEQASLARFHGGRFPGSWLAARLRFGDVIAEIGIPLSEGEASLAAFWIPTTLRAAGSEPPPPPVDLTERYHLTFVAADRADRGLLDIKAGDLVADEFRMIVPAGWRVALSSRARRGFPVRMRPQTGGAVIVVDRLPAQDAALEQRQAAALGSEAEDGITASWTPVARPSRYRAAAGFEAEFRRDDPEGPLRGQALLLRPREGDGDLALRIEAPEEEWDAALEKTVELTFGSVRFRKARKN
jgi:hypothetical protein